MPRDNFSEHEPRNPKYSRASGSRACSSDQSRPVNTFALRKSIRVTDCHHFRMTGASEQEDQFVSINFAFKVKNEDDYMRA